MRTLKATGTGFALAILAVALAAPATAQDGSFERTLTVTGAVNLSVDTNSGGITVTTGSSGRVVIRGKIRRRRNMVFRRGSAADVEEAEQNPPISQTGNTIRITKLDSSLRRKLSISYEITVPQNTKVSADTGSGSIRISGVEGPVDADTGSGSIRLEDIPKGATTDTGSGSIKAFNVGERFSADTGSGSIHAELISAGPVNLDTGSGSIRVSGVEGRLTASTGSGSIKIEGIPSGDWEVKSSSGGITVVVPENSSFDLYARTSSGGIRTDFPITVQGRISKKKLSGRVGQGGPRMELRTSSGSIRIEKGGRTSQ